MNNNEIKTSVVEYAAFDAVSLKNLIVKRLNASNLFTDQNFEGSNISAIIDIIAYSYHVLMFYLNKTASESLFSQATIYENIVKIVKELNYKPVGYQTAVLPFKAYANDTLSVGSYTIPRYSYFTINGINYSFIKDATLTKKTSDFEFLTDLQDNNLLYQGTFIEYPEIVANGKEFEQFTLIYTSDDPNEKIDHFSFDIYVKEKNTGKYFKYTECQSLFLENQNARVFERTFNENERYEIKFGNGINGRQLEEGDIVQVYFLVSNGSSAEVSAGDLNGNSVTFYRTEKLNIIFADTRTYNANIITALDADKIAFTNIDPSSKFTTKESVDKIKLNAPKLFSSQNRLVNSSDYEGFVNKNFGNFVSSVKAVNNWDYVKGHLKYFHDMGFGNPNVDPRILLTQTKFADACDFNNVYIYGVPKLEKVTSLTQRTNFLNSSQKELILNEIRPLKMLTTEVIINDPVYVAVDFGTRPLNGEDLKPEIASSSSLVVVKNVLSRADSEYIKSEVNRIFTEYFKSTNDNLGLLIDINDLSNQLFNITGVINFYTQTVDKNNPNIKHTQPGINFLVWNPIYPENDIQIVSQNYQLPYFKYPFLTNPLDFINKIIVESVDTNVSRTEY